MTDFQHDMTRQFELLIGNGRRISKTKHRTGRVGVRYQPPIPANPSLEGMLKWRDGVCRTFGQSDLSREKSLRLAFNLRVIDVIQGATGFRINSYGSNRPPYIRIPCITLHIMPKPNQKWKQTHRKLSIHHISIIEELKNSGLCVRIDKYRPAVKKYWTYKGVEVHIHVLGEAKAQAMLDWFQERGARFQKYFKTPLIKTYFPGSPKFPTPRDAFTVIGVFPESM